MGWDEWDIFHRYCFHIHTWYRRTGRPLLGQGDWITRHTQQTGSYKATEQHYQTVPSFQALYSTIWEEVRRDTSTHLAQPSKRRSTGQVSINKPASRYLFHTLTHLSARAPPTWLPHMPTTTTAVLSYTFPRPPLADLHPIAPRLHLKLHHTAHCTAV